MLNVLETPNIQVIVYFRITYLSNTREKYEKQHLELRSAFAFVAMDTAKTFRFSCLTKRAMTHLSLNDIRSVFYLMMMRRYNTTLQENGRARVNKNICAR